MPALAPAVVDRLKSFVRRDRLVKTVVDLVAVPSRTGEGGLVHECLARMLAEEGFAVERPVAGHPAAPAVAVRLKGAKAGRTLQFNGHLDTVHLPFVPPAVHSDRITGSGSCDVCGRPSEGLTLRTCATTPRRPG